MDFMNDGGQPSRTEDPKYSNHRGRAQAKWDRWLQRNYRRHACNFAQSMPRGIESVECWFRCFGTSFAQQREWREAIEAFVFFVAAQGKQTARSRG